MRAIRPLMFLGVVVPSALMTVPDPEWLETYLDDNPAAIEHERIGNEVVLTAATAE
jgi:hypothetical protein